jgi:ADP-heptose:LPS heptosyltransferase
MGKTLVYQAILGTHRRLLGSEGRIGSFSLARDIEFARKAIVVPEGGLESLVLTRSCLRGFKKRYPSCSVSVVTPGEYSSVLEGDYWTNRLFFYNERSINPFNRSLKDLVEQLRAESFDIAIDLSYSHNLQTYLPVSLSGAAITVGFYDPARIFRYSISVRSTNGKRPFLPRLWSLFGVLDIYPEKDIYRLPGREASVDTVWKTVGLSEQTKREQLLGVFLDDTQEGVAGKREELTSLLKVLNTLPSKKILLAQNRVSRSVWEDMPRYDILVLPRETIAKIASILKECHCVLTNNIGFALLMASIGGRVIAVVHDKDVVKLSLRRISGIKPFILRGKELPVHRLGEFVKATMKSVKTD